MYIYYNPNPAGKQVGDCVVRGICKITGQNWEETFIAICVKGYELRNLPSANEVWETYLLEKGYKRTLIRDTCPLCYKVKNFCNEHPKGVFLLATGTHVVAVKDGDYYDAWDSGDEVPIYYWERERSKLNDKF